MAGVGTTTTTASALRQYWHDFFLENLYAAFTLKGLTKKTTVGKGQGKVVWWYGITKVSPAGAALSEGADPAATSSAARRVSGTLAEYGKLVKNSRLLMDTAIQGTREQIMKDLAMDAGKLLNDTVLGKALGGTNVVYAGGKVIRSDVVEANTATIDEVRKCVRLLKLSSAEPFEDGYFVALVHPDVAYDLMSDSKWLDISKYRDSVKYDIPGEVGRLYGVRFVEDPTIQVLLNSGSANTDIYRTPIFGKNFIGQSEMGGLEIVINEPGRNSELRQFNTYGFRFVMATEILHNARGVRLESNATLA